MLLAKVKNSRVATAPGALASNKPMSTVATGSGVATDTRKVGTRGGSRPRCGEHERYYQRSLVAVRVLAKR